jgi:hypothetical protein
VDIVIDQIRYQVRHRVAGAVDGGPDLARPLVPGEFVKREWLVVGDLGYADIGETPPGGPLDVLKGRKFADAGRSDRIAGSLCCRVIVLPGHRAAGLPAHSLTLADVAPHRGRMWKRPTYCGPDMGGQHVAHIPDGP